MYQVSRTRFQTGLMKDWSPKAEGGAFYFDADDDYLPTLHVPSVNENVLVWKEQVMVGSEPSLEMVPVCSHISSSSSEWVQMGR